MIRTPVLLYFVSESPNLTRIQTHHLRIGHVTLIKCKYVGFMTWQEENDRRKRAASWQNQQNGNCAQRRLISDWAETQISLGIRPVWSVFAVHSVGSYKEQRFLHADSENSDPTGRIGRSESLLGAHAILFVLSRGGSYGFAKLIAMYLSNFTCTCISWYSIDYFSVSLSHVSIWLFANLLYTL